MTEKSRLKPGTLSRLKNIALFAAVTSPNAIEHQADTHASAIVRSLKTWFSDWWGRSGLQSDVAYQSAAYDSMICCRVAGPLRLRGAKNESRFIASYNQSLDVKPIRYRIRGDRPDRLLGRVVDVCVETGRCYSWLLRQCLPSRRQR